MLHLEKVTESDTFVGEIVFGLFEEVALRVRLLRGSCSSVFRLWILLSFDGLEKSWVRISERSGLHSHVRVLAHRSDSDPWLLVCLN